MPVSEFHRHKRSLLELKQTGTVAEYTAAFWERVVRVLDLSSDLSIGCFVNQYVEGLREDIQAAVRSRSPSSISRASSLARIREDEIVKDAAMAVEELDDGYDHGVHGHMTSETFTDVFPELAALVECGAGHGATAFDVSSLAAPTLTTCSTECPSHDAATLTSALTSAATPTSSMITVDIFPELAAPAVRDKSIDIDTISVMTPTPVTCSTGGLTHGDVHSPVAVEMLRPLPWPSFVIEHTSTACSSIVLLDTFASCSWVQVMVLEDISHKKGCQVELEFRPPPNSKTVSPKPRGQAEEIGDNKLSCGSITVYQWFVYNESIEAPLATTDSKVLSFRGYLSLSHNSIPVNALYNYSVMWCLAGVFLRRMQWCSDTQCVQPTSAISEALFSAERHGTELPTQVLALAVSSLQNLFWSQAAPSPPMTDFLEGRHQLKYIWGAQCVHCCVLKKSVKKRFHICAAAHQTVRLSWADMKPFSQVYRSFILYVHSTVNDKPTYSVIIASSDDGYNLSYISVIKWRAFHQRYSLGDNKVKLSHCGTTGAKNNIFSVIIMNHFTYSVENLLGLSHVVWPLSFVLSDIGKIRNCFPFLQPKPPWLLSSQVIYSEMLLGIPSARKLCSVEEKAVLLLVHRARAKIVSDGVKYLPCPFLLYNVVLDCTSLWSTEVKLDKYCIEAGHLSIFLCQQLNNGLKAGYAYTMDDALETLVVSFPCTSTSPRPITWPSFSPEENAEKGIMLMGINLHYHGYAFYSNQQSKPHTTQSNFRMWSSMHVPMPWDPGIVHGSTSSDCRSLELVFYGTGVALEMNHEKDNGMDLGERQDVLGAWQMLSKIPPGRLSGFSTGKYGKEDVCPMSDKVPSWRQNGFSHGKCEHQHDLHWKNLGSCNNRKIIENTQLFELFQNLYLVHCRSWRPPGLLFALQQLYGIVWLYDPGVSSGASWVQNCKSIPEMSLFHPIANLLHVLVQEDGKSINLNLELCGQLDTEILQIVRMCVVSAVHACHCISSLSQLQYKQWDPGVCEILSAEVPKLSAISTRDSTCQAPRL